MLPTILFLPYPCGSYSILNAIVMNIHIVLKTRLRSVSKNARMAEKIKASPNSTRALKIMSTISFRFLEEMKVICQFWDKRKKKQTLPKNEVKIGGRADILRINKKQTTICL